MLDEDGLDEVVTKFLFDTCRLHTKFNEHALMAALNSAGVITRHPIEDEDTDPIPSTTGSVAEFYIEPMLPAANDVDVMCYLNSTLAIPRGHPLPTELPADEFHNLYLAVSEIFNSYLPGYVYLEERFHLIKLPPDGDKYIALKLDENRWQYISNRRPLGEELPTHGPAVITSVPGDPMPYDTVPCMRCLVWPPQAAEWPQRYRFYDWPDSVTLDRVVSNGCDVVPVAHRQCRRYFKWMGRYQWRLSFSRAEIILINGWTIERQIIYHMLRFFVKYCTLQLTESADNSEAGTLSNYHIKTLMLWYCELKPNSWWTDDLGLVRICVELLHVMAFCQFKGECWHYFIEKCNLFDRPFDMVKIASLLWIDKKRMSLWFIHNYVGTCAHMCPEGVLRLFDDVSTSMKLQKAVSAVVDWRLSTPKLHLFIWFNNAEYMIARHMFSFPITVRSCVCLMNEIEKLHVHLTFYVAAVIFLEVASKIGSDGLNVTLLDVLQGTNDHVRLPSHSYNHRIGLFLCQLRITLITLMFTGKNTSDLNTSPLIELLQQCAIEYLTTYRQAEERDVGFVATIVTTDFQALYAYKRGEYHHCLRLCKQNVRWLMFGSSLDVSTFPEFIQLLDDDIVSLIALTWIVDPECRNGGSMYVSISQLTLSLYLMAQCQMKLRHSVKSIVETFRCIKVARPKHHIERALDHLTLELAACKLSMYMSTIQGQF